MTKTIVLCADDFGQAPHISQAILTLADHNRLSAVSCMTTTQDWQQQGGALKEFRDRLDLGLHFNLTWGNLYPPSPLSWLLRAFTARIDLPFIKKQLNEQLDSFESVTGFLPDFIDGHQHVHSFPLIRDVLVEVIKTRFPKKKPYCRALSPLLVAPDARLKALILRLVAFGFSRKLDHNTLAHPPQFGGVYSLNDKVPYRKYMLLWLAQAKSGALLMCHPGKQALNDPSDPIQKARLEEYLYLLSPKFPQDCLQAGITLGKFNSSRG